MKLPALTGKFVALPQQIAQGGRGLFEFGAAVAIFGVLVAILLQRLNYYQEEAERVAVGQVVANIQSALKIRLAQGNLPGHGIDLDTLARQNPIELLATRPANYAGEYFSPTRQDVRPGNWYFDRYDKTLIYLLNSGKTFGIAEPKQLKYKVKLFRLPTSPAKPSAATTTVVAAFEQVNG